MVLVAIYGIYVTVLYMKDRDRPFGRSSVETSISSRLKLWSTSRPRRRSAVAGRSPAPISRRQPMPRWATQAFQTGRGTRSHPRLPVYAAT